jgi:hypothetical protein
VTVFVSYSSRDRDAVKSLTQDLQDADEQVWMDRRLAGGEAWWCAILEQIRGCDVFIFALSQSSIESRPCQAELQYAQALGLPVLPVQVGAVDSMQLNPLATVQAVDYRRPTPSTAMRLSTAMHRERARRQPLPEPLPAEPSVPFEYLIRLYTTISNPDYLAPRDQAALVAQLQVGLREDGQHEAARADIVTLLRKLHDREDVTYRTRADVEAILASVGATLDSSAHTNHSMQLDVQHDQRAIATAQVDEPKSTHAARDSPEATALSSETTAEPRCRRLLKPPTRRRAAEVILGPDLLKLLNRLWQTRTRTKVLAGTAALLVAVGAIWFSHWPRTESPTTSQHSIKSLPGTDRLGWIDYPAARCDPGTQLAAVARTTQSVLVVCEIQPGDFYYRGVRLSDGASIELANMVRSSGSFDVTDPTDGTKYRLRPTSLTISRPDTQASSSEAVLAYSSS